jgi:hypothetical protein
MVSYVFKRCRFQRAIFCAVVMMLASKPAQALDLSVLPKPADYMAVVPHPTVDLACNPHSWTTSFYRFNDAWFAATWWMSAEGDTQGVVEQASWRQLLRSHFVYTNTCNEVVSQAVQPWGEGVVWPARIKLTFSDGDDLPLGDVQGQATLGPKPRFVIHNAQGEAVSQVTLDGSADTIRFMHTGAFGRPCATLTRTQHTALSSQWRLAVGDRYLLPDAVWPVLAAFFMDRFDRLNHGGSAPSDPNVIETASEVAARLETLR